MTAGGKRFGPAVRVINYLEKPIGTFPPKFRKTSGWRAGPCGEYSPREAAEGSEAISNPFNL
jgi:hypothetical protein